MGKSSLKYLLAWYAFLAIIVLLLASVLMQPADATIISNATTAGWSTSNVSLNGSMLTGNGNITNALNASYYPNLVAFYPMREIAGNILHNLNNANGTYNSTNPCTWTGGTLNGTGTYLIFNGINNYFSCGKDASLSTGTAVTLMAQVNFSGKTSSRTGIISKMKSSSPYNGYELGIESVGGYGYFHSGGTYSNDVEGTSIINNSNFHTVSGVYENIIGIGASNAVNPSVSNAGYLAENIVFDNITNLYWWVAQNLTSGNTSIAYSSTINGTYTLQSGDIAVGGAPYLLLYNDTWYLYTANTSGIVVQTSSRVNNSYGSAKLVLAKGSAGTWDANRVSEPFVSCSFFVNECDMLFMGEDAPNGIEKVGFATVAAPNGTFTPYANNPVLSGNTSWWDKGNDKAADPYAVLYNGTIYVGITATDVGKSKWNIGFFTTSDFINYTANPTNPVLLPNTSYTSAFDTNSVLRGGVTFDNGTAYMAYTGRNATTTYFMALTTINFSAMLPRSELYVDGVIEKAGNRANNLASSGITAKIGTQYNTTYFFNGSMKNVGIWSRNLTQSEIAIFSSTPWRTKANPTFWQQNASSGYVVNRSRVMIYNTDANLTVNLFAKPNSSASWTLLQSAVTNGTWYDIPPGIRSSSMDFMVTLNGNGSYAPIFNSLEYDITRTTSINPSVAFGVAAMGTAAAIAIYTWMRRRPPGVMMLGL